MGKQKQNYKTFEEYLDSIGFDYDFEHNEEILEEANNYAKLKEVHFSDVSSRLYLVTYDGQDNDGSILKGIKIIAKDEQGAIKRIEEIKTHCGRVYSAIKA